MKDFIDFVENRTRLCEGVNPIPYNKESPHGDMRPGPLDNSFEQWINRISQWGRLTIEHQNVLGRKNQITPQTLERLLDDTPYGDPTIPNWDTDLPAFSKLVFERRYWAPEAGKVVTEKIIMKIDLRPELKKAVSWWNVLNPFK